MREGYAVGVVVAVADAVVVAVSVVVAVAVFICSTIAVVAVAVAVAVAGAVAVLSGSSVVRRVVAVAGVVVASKKPGRTRNVVSKALGILDCDETADETSKALGALVYVFSYSNNVGATASKALGALAVAQRHIAASPHRTAAIEVAEATKVNATAPRPFSPPGHRLLYRTELAADSPAETGR